MKTTIMLLLLSLILVGCDNSSSKGNNTLDPNLNGVWTMNTYQCNGETLKPTTWTISNDRIKVRTQINNDCFVSYYSDIYSRKTQFGSFVDIMKNFTYTTEGESCQGIDTELNAMNLKYVISGNVLSVVSMNDISCAAVLSK